MSEERAQYGEAEPLLREVLRIAARTVNFARPADLRRILLEAADENERLRAALELIVTDHEFCGDDWGDRREAWIETARAALNHAAPAAQQEGE